MTTAGSCVGAGRGRAGFPIAAPELRIEDCCTL